MLSLYEKIPVEFGECCEPRDADRGAALLGGLPPAERGLPGGKLSATDIKAAIGLCPVPVGACADWAVAPAFGSGGEPVRLFKGEFELVPFAFATDTGTIKKIVKKTQENRTYDLLWPETFKTLLFSQFLKQNSNSLMNFWIHNSRF